MNPYGQSLRRGEHRIILGVPGSGKSTLARELVSTARRVVYFDPHGDYADIRGATLIEPANLTQEHLAQKYCRIVCLAERSDDYDVADEYVFVARHCREARGYGGLVFVCDEVGDYNSGRAQRALRSLFRNGHKDGIVTILVSQRAVDIPLGCRATATSVTSLLQDSAQDYDTLCEQYGQEFADKARNWKPGDRPAVWERVELWPRY
jgi:hypothetical protein